MPSLLTHKEDPAGTSNETEEGNVDISEPSVAVILPAENHLTSTDASSCDTSFKSVMPTPKMNQNKTNKPRKKAINYKGILLRRELFTEYDDEDHHSGKHPFSF